MIDVPIHITNKDLKSLVYCYILAEFNGELNRLKIAPFPLAITDFVLCNKQGTEALNFSSHWYKDPTPGARGFAKTGQLKNLHNIKAQVLIARVCI
jgi:hypothetical protein